MSWNALLGWEDDYYDDEAEVPDRQQQRVERLLDEMRSGKRSGRESNTSQVIKDELLVAICGWPTKVERLEAENESTNGVVDYLLRLPDVHVHLEVKRANRELQDDWISKYLNGGPEQRFEFGILTNGIEWRLFARARELPSIGLLRLGETSDLAKVVEFLRYAGLSERLRKSLLASTTCTRGLCRSSAAPQREFAEAFQKHFDAKPPLLTSIVDGMDALERDYRRRRDALRYSAETLMGVAAMRTDTAAEGFRNAFRTLVGFKRIGSGSAHKAVEQAFPFPHEWEALIDESEM